MPSLVVLLIMPLSMAVAIMAEHGWTTPICGRGQICDDSSTYNHIETFPASTKWHWIPQETYDVFIGYVRLNVIAHIFVYLYDNRVYK